MLLATTEAAQQQPAPNAFGHTNTLGTTRRHCNLAQQQIIHVCVCAYVYTVIRTQDGRPERPERGARVLNDVCAA